MSFLFPLGDIAPPAPANTFFPEQATVSFSGAADLNGGVIFPELLAALSEADVRPSSPETADRISSFVAEMAPFSALPRPAVTSNRHDGLRRLAKANNEQNDAVICATRYTLPWAGGCHGMELEFGSSPSPAIPPAQTEPGEELMSEDSVPDSLFVTLPAGFSPMEPMFEKPPVSADAFVEASTIQEEPFEGDEPQRAAAMSTPPAAESEDGIPVRDGAERHLEEESLPATPGQDSSLLIPPLPGAAENRTEGGTPSSESVSSLFPRVPSTDDARSQTADGRQSDPAISKVSLSDRAEPVPREAFRLLLRENIALTLDTRAAATPPPVPYASRQTSPFGSLEQNSNGAARLSPTLPQESPTEIRSVRSRASIRTQQTILDTTPFAKTPLPSVTPEVSGLAEATEKRIELTVRGTQGGSTYNSETKPHDPANGIGEKPEVRGKPVLSREQLALLVHSRPTVEPFHVRSVSEHVAPATAVEEPMGVHAGQHPVRQLRVSLPPSEAGGGVQLLLQQRPGGVEVSVHSPNQSVRETLRSSLSELIGSLDRKGVVTEALPSIPALSAGFGERVDSAGQATSSEVLEGDRGEDPKNRQDRPPQWESGGDNRRRRNPDADAWKKYLEEYAWRNQ